MSTKISFLSFLLFLIGLPPLIDYWLMLDIGLDTAVDGAVLLLNMFHFDLTLSFICIFPSVGGTIITGSLTVYYLMFSVATNWGWP